jgi:hypothetical protein
MVQLIWVPPLLSVALADTRSGAVVVAANVVAANPNEPAKAMAAATSP